MISFRLLFCLTFYFVFNSLYSQNTITIYYDYLKTMPQEEYSINSVGQKHGKYTRYSMSGHILEEANYVNGDLNGTYIENYCHKLGNGSYVVKLKTVGQYKNNSKHGVFTTYDYLYNSYSFLYYSNIIFYSPSEQEIADNCILKGKKIKAPDYVYEYGKLKKHISYSYYPDIYGVERKYAIRDFSGSSDNFNEYDLIHYSLFTDFKNKSILVADGSINDEGKMIGNWIIPKNKDGLSIDDEVNNRKKNSYFKVSTLDKQYTDEIEYYQKLRFLTTGELDTTYTSKTYYLNGQLKDSVKVIKLDYDSYRHNGYGEGRIWMFCGSNSIIKGPYRSYYMNNSIDEIGTYGINNGKSIKIGIWEKYDVKGALLNKLDYDLSRLTIEEIESNLSSAILEKNNNNFSISKNHFIKTINLLNKVINLNKNYDTIINQYTNTKLIECELQLKEINEFLDLRKTKIYSYQTVSKSEFNKFKIEFSKLLISNSKNLTAGENNIKLTLKFDTLGQNQSIFTPTNNTILNEKISKMISELTSPKINGSYVFSEFLYDFKINWKTNTHVVYSDYKGIYTKEKNFLFFNECRTFINQLNHPYGKFTFSNLKIRLNDNGDSSHLDNLTLVKVKTRGGPFNMFYSLVMPGWGTKKVYYDKEKGNIYRAWYILCTSVGGIAKGMELFNINEVENSEDIEDFQKIVDETNTLRKINLIAFGVTGILYVYDVSRTFVKGVSNVIKTRKLNNNIKNNPSLVFDLK